MPVRFADGVGNLPANYAELLEPAQRLARLNALRLRETPEDQVRAWEIFRTYYLQGGGFYKRLKPSPRTHYQWIYSCAAQPRNIFGAPRGFAKSVVLGTEYPLMQSIVFPGTDILVGTLEKGKAKKRGQRWMTQLLHNRRIREDFGDLQGNNRRDGRLWGLGVMQLTNGSCLQTTSVSSLNLGERPDIAIWDDVDPDPQVYKGSIDTVVNDLITALFDVWLPMLDEAELPMYIIGTLLHRRSFLYWAMTTRDQRLRYWNRLLTSATGRDGKPTWPEKFPLKRLAHLKRQLGPAAYGAAYENNPRSGEDAVLQFHSRRTGFDVVDLDTEVVTDPFKSSATLVSYQSDDKTAVDHDPVWKEQRQTFGAAMTQMAFFVLGDYAEGLQSQHDYSALVVVGVDKHDVWYVVDLWMGRGTPEDVATKAWGLVLKWRAKVVAIEAVGAYKALARRIVETRGEVEKMVGWVPRIKQVTYPAHLDKPTRIAGLQWRFDEGRIRIWNRTDGAWAPLRGQIDGFTMDLKNLQNDDLIDALAILPQVLSVGGRVGESKELLESKRQALARRLVGGDTVDPDTGIPYITGMALEDVPVNEMRFAQAPPPVETPVKVAIGRLPGVFSLNDLAKELARGDESELDADAGAFG